MDYISTRGSAPTLDFRAATLAGLASDGGLYVPAQWPRLSEDEIRALAGLDYVETAVRVMAPFVAGSLSEDALRALCRPAYGRFVHDARSEEHTSELQSLMRTSSAVFCLKT